MMKGYFSLLMMVAICNLANAQQTISLYRGKAPGSENWTWTENEFIDKASKTRFIYNVSEPTLTAYLPKKPVATGTAVIVAPGGGFHLLSIDNEGINVAKWLNDRGIAAFILKYRVIKSETNDPMQELMPFAGKWDAFDKNIAPVLKPELNDGLEAVKYLRTHANELHINPDHIGFMGFSAGGTVTMSVVYNATAESRPNFVVPVYAYGRGIIEQDVPKEKTPIFIVVASDDQNDFAPHSIQIYSKWLAAKQPVELHAYAKGGHGFGTAKQNLPVDSWMDRFGDWLKQNGFLP